MFSIDAIFRSLSTAALTWITLELLLSHPLQQTAHYQSGMRTVSTRQGSVFSQAFVDWVNSSLWNRALLSSQRDGHYLNSCVPMRFLDSCWVLYFNYANSEGIVVES